MRREILFRGQTRKTGEKVYMDGRKVPGNWVYGGICSGKGDFSIVYATMDEEKEIPVEKHVVYTETVGQYTGLNDKNGKMIFEGDIVIYDNTPYNVYSTPKTGVIVWRKNAFRLKYREYETCWYFDLGSDDFFGAKCEVLGNIHDNPELLEAE